MNDEQMERMEDFIGANTSVSSTEEEEEFDYSEEEW